MTSTLVTRGTVGTPHGPEGGRRAASKRPEVGEGPGMGPPQPSGLRAPQLDREMCFRWPQGQTRRLFHSGAYLPGPFCHHKPPSASRKGFLFIRPRPQLSTCVLTPHRAAASPRPTHVPAQQGAHPAGWAAPNSISAHGASPPTQHQPGGTRGRICGRCGPASPVRGVGGSPGGAPGGLQTQPRSPGKGPGAGGPWEGPEHAAGQEDS